MNQIKNNVTVYGAVNKSLYQVVRAAAYWTVDEVVYRAVCLPVDDLM